MDQSREFDEFLGTEVRIHDKHRFEVKLDVGVKDGERHVYRVETYLFIPRTLGINPATYAKADFYNDIQRYIRFKTPQFSVSKLTDPAEKNSPLARLKSMLDGILAGAKTPSAVESAYEEIKLLACVVRVALRDQSKFFIDELARIPDEEGDQARIAVFKEQVGAFLDGLESFILSVHGLREALAAPAAPDRLREALAFADEYFSIAAEDTLTEILAAIRARAALRAGLSAVDAHLAALIKGQEAYRAERGYPSLVDKGTDSETFIYRSGVLKKFVSSVLYLQIETSAGEREAQIIFGIAAGLAMAIFMVVAYYANTRYTPTSMTFAMILTVGYIVKDRIKDLLKLWFLTRWTRWASDRSTEITDPATGKVIGRMREAFSFVRLASVPDEIKRRRFMDNITAIENEGKPEEIIRYEKEVTLFPKLITQFHERRKDLNDILRINISPFLEQADDPKAEHVHLNGKTGKVEVLQCARVYHVNALMRYVVRASGEAETVKYERFRIVLTRKGIKRLEVVPAVVAEP